MSFGPEDDFAPGELTCQELAEIITDYLEGALSPLDRARFEDHVAECDDCATYVEQLRVTIAVTGRVAADDLAPAFRAELLGVFRGWAGRGGGDR
jgi:anti-sigma factor RsiW